MHEIYTLLINLEYSRECWERKIEIAADATLDDLHDVIQWVVEFDKDHMYEFYTAKKVRSQKRLRRFTYDGNTEEEAGALAKTQQDMLKHFNELFSAPFSIEPPVREEPLDTQLNQIFPLPPGHFLFYLFDYGDDWRFRIRKINRKAQFARENMEYPRMIDGKGENPQQYPSIDDDWY